MQMNKLLRPSILADVSRPAPMMDFTKFIWSWAREADSADDGFYQVHLVMGTRGR